MTVEIEMPKYQCHKKVHALQIKHLNPLPVDPESGDSNVMMWPEDEGHGGVVLSESWVEKHSPREGGYYVVYADGYKSYSPAEAFEDGYTKV